MLAPGQLVLLKRMAALRDASSGKSYLAYKGELKIDTVGMFVSKTRHFSDWDTFLINGGLYAVHKSCIERFHD